MDGKTDFFELPVGDQHHRERIEIEHSDDYRRGYEDGVESFRPKFEAIKKLLQQNQTCSGCEAEFSDAHLPMCTLCDRPVRADYFKLKES